MSFFRLSLCMIPLVILLSVQGIAFAQDANITKDEQTKNSELQVTVQNPDITASEDITRPPTLISPTSQLPHDLSPWGMFVQADWVVKSVMIGLLLASIATWTVLVAKVREIRALVKGQRYTLSLLDDAEGLSSAQQILKDKQADQVLTLAASKELELSADLFVDPQGVKDRVASRLQRLEVAFGKKVALGTGILATIGSTAPFIGLFGTVWGIMNSFIGISKAQTTNLAVVAPGIAEALLATALGLVAAIPAVVIYNHFSRRISTYKVLLADTSAAVMRLVSRDLSRHMASQSAVEKE